jgi:F-type H+-transporting ATPase subunit b
MATEAVEHAASACVGPLGSAIGMPQLCADWIPNQIFWLLVTLVVIYLVLSRVALPRIASVLAERSGTITNDIAAAEDLKVRVKEAEAAYDKALADARSEAAKIVAVAKAEIQSELDVELAKADAKIDGAVKSVTAVAKDTAGEIVAALGGKADAKTVTAAVTARMKG